MYNSLIEKLNTNELLGGAEGEPRSQTIVGITKLIESNPDKALEHFESALAKHHELPAAWLGKAYVEAMKSSPEREYAAYIRRSVKQSLKHSKEQKAIIEQFAGILGTALKRNAELMEESIERADQAGKKAAEKKKESFWSAVGAVAAAGVALKSDSEVVQAASGAGAAGAAGKAAHDSVKAEQLESLKEDIYGVAVGYLWYSLPLAQNAAILRKEFSLKESKLLEEIIESWKQSAIKVFKKEKSNQVENMRDIADKIETRADLIDIKNKSEILEKTLKKLGIKKDTKLEKVKGVRKSAKRILNEPEIIEKHRKAGALSNIALLVIIAQFIALFAFPPAIITMILSIWIYPYTFQTERSVNKLENDVENLDVNLTYKHMNLAGESKEILGNQKLLST